ncbi:MAG: hypothetical protein ABIR79_12650, partial [Candidatus Binatia bacterium]
HAQRQARTEYRNYVDPILSLNCSYLFSKPITREATPPEHETDSGPVVPFSGGARVAPPTPAEKRAPMTGKLAKRWTDFCGDVDRRGNSIDRFMRRAAYYTLGLGVTFAVVDRPRIERAPQSKAEEDEMGLDPYYALYLPTELVNWEVDEDGRFVWVRFREPIANDVGPYDPKNADRTRLYSPDPRLPSGTIFEYGDPMRARTPRPMRALYRTFTRDEWILDEIDGNELRDRGRGQHGLGVVPVVPIFNRQPGRYAMIGRSEVHDIVGLNQGILNLDSLITEAVYQQALNILVMKRQANQQKEIVIGAENILTYTGDQMPGFITPSTAPLAYMEQRIQGLIGEIYRLAKFKGGQAMQVQSVPSGVAATVEFNEADRALAEKAEELQNAEFLLHDLWARAHGARFDGTVDYPDSFQVSAFNEELQQITTAKTAVRSDRFIRELEKRVARRMLPNVPETTMKAIEEEIDIIPPSIQSFSGPVWFDPITQEVRQPTDPAAPPIGILGELFERSAQEQGMDPDQLTQELGPPMVPAPVDPAMMGQGGGGGGGAPKPAAAKPAAKSGAKPAPAGPHDRAKAHAARKTAPPPAKNKAAS